ncbi:MAG: TusE/DsrC/DsvC family sulfur relay protein [Pontibacterium sp.]
MALMINGKPIEIDSEGYLCTLDDWSTDVAEQIALSEGLELTADHWAVLQVLREFYQTFELSPAMRPFVKAVGQKLGADKGKSMYLMRLFPGSPAKLAAKIAGLPKPSNCL